MATTYMALTLPTEGGSDDTWDTILNTALTAIDAHDHSTGNGKTVPSSGITVDADIDFDSNGITTVSGVGFASGTLAGTSKLVLSGSELYWRTSGGASLAVTQGNYLNPAHDSRYVMVHASSAAFPAGSSAVYTGPYVTLGSADVVDVPLNVQSGISITRVDITHYKTAAGTTTFDLRKINTIGTDSSVQTATRTTTTGWTIVQLTPASAESVDGTSTYYLRVTGSSAAERVAGVGALHTR